MSTLPVLLIAALVAVIVVGVLLVALSSRRAQTQADNKMRAHELRVEATAEADVIRERELDAQTAQVEADRARLEAERAEARAVQALLALEQTEAQVEDKVREADRLDPEVDDRSDSYSPGSLDAADDGAPAVAAKPGPDEDWDDEPITAPSDGPGAESSSGPTSEAVTEWGTEPNIGLETDPGTDSSDDTQ